MNRLALLPAILALAACGGGNKPAPAEPGTAEPATAEPTTDPEAELRTEEDCAAILDHLESVSVEAIDREGMMTACLEEWSEARAACLETAADNDGIAACWED